MKGSCANSCARWGSRRGCVMNLPRCFQGFCEVRSRTAMLRDWRAQATSCRVQTCRRRPDMFGDRGQPGGNSLMRQRPGRTSLSPYQQQARMVLMGNSIGARPFRCTSERAQTFSMHIRPRPAPTEFPISLLAQRSERGGQHWRSSCRTPRWDGTTRSVWLP